MNILAKKASKAKDGSKKNLEVPILAIADNIVFSKKEVWAYYKLSTVPYDFLSSDAKAGLANSTITGLASFCQNEGRKVDGHVLITNTPFDISSWVNQVDRDFIIQNPGMGNNRPYNDFIEGQIIELANGGYNKPVVYFGVKLFNRGSFDIDSINVFEFGFKDAFGVFKKAVSNMFVMPNEDVTAFEEDKARVKEKEVFRTLESGNLRGQKVTAEELLLTLKRQFYPFMPSPYLEVDHGNRIGLSDIAIETGGVIDNQYRALRIEQEIDGEIYEGYRATLCFARFPDYMAMPGPQTPFLYMPAHLGLPYTMNARFTMIPHNEMKKDLNKKKMEASDEIENLAGSGQGANSSITGTVRDIDILENTLENEKLPWLNGAYRVTVEMPTFDDLKSAVSDLKQAYADNDTTLVWTTGDQLDLFIEEMPGANIRMNSFNQKTSLSMLAVSGFNIGGVVGDPIDEQLILSKRRNKRRS